MHRSLGKLVVLIVVLEQESLDWSAETAVGVVWVAEDVITKDKTDMQAKRIKNRNVFQDSFLEVDKKDKEARGGS